MRYVQEGINETREPEEPLKVGSEIWTIDPRNRREGWKSFIINGETRMSWLIGSGRAVSKISKETMLENHGQWGKQRWYSKSQMEQQRFIDDYRHHIAQLVSVESDAMKLKKISEVLGLELTCNPPS